MSWNARKELPQRLYRFKPRPQLRTSQTHTPVRIAQVLIVAVWERQQQAPAGKLPAWAPCPVPAFSVASCPCQARRSGAVVPLRRPGRVSFRPMHHSWAQVRSHFASSCSCRRVMHNRHLLGPGHCSRHCTCRIASRSGVRCCNPVADNTPEEGQRCAALIDPRLPGGLRTQPSQGKGGGDRTG